MKILFLCASPPRAQGLGDSVIAYNRIRLLSRRGHKIGLACFLGGQSSRVSPELESMVSELVQLPSPKGTLTVKRAVRRLVSPMHAEFIQYASRNMSRAVGRLVAHGHYDVAVAGSAVMGQYLYRNVYLPAIRRVICCHGRMAGACRRTSALNPFDVSRLGVWLRPNRTERFEVDMFRFADRIISMTLQERLSLLRRCPDLNVSIIPYGVDVDRLAPRPTTPPGREILFSGCFSETADYEAAHWFARQVWPMLAERHPDLILRLACPGDGRELRGLLKRYPRIEQVSEAPDAQTSLMRSRLFVCPMRSAAGFQGRVLRAMATGVPVVATSIAVDSIPVQTGENVFLADTAHNMAEVIGLLLSDDELHRQMAVAGRALVEKRFSWQKCVDKLEEVLRRLLPSEISSSDVARTPRPPPESGPR